MTTGTGKRPRPPDECEDSVHDAALKKMAGRSVDFRPFRRACFAMLEMLEKLGENARDPKAEQRRINVMNSIEGVLHETDCGQTMIENF